MFQLYLFCTMISTGACIVIILREFARLINLKLRHHCRQLLIEHRNREAKRYLMYRGFDEEEAIYYLHQLNQTLTKAL